MRKTVVRGALIAFFSITSLQLIQAQVIDTLERHWPAYINLDQYMRSFLTADTIYNELVMPLADGEAAARGSLLFPVHSVLSVRDVYLGTVYEEGADWICEDQRIVLTDSSRIPYFALDQLVFTELKEGVSQPGSKEGTYVLFSEGELLRARQLAVTYIPDRRKGGVAMRLPPITDRLQRTAGRLADGKDLHVVFFGNSIETGANSSGFHHVPPFMPNWAELFVRKLRTYFDSYVSYKNLAVGGKTAAWGLENVGQVNAEQPDLVVIGFGMNDGTFGVPVVEFAQQINAIMDTVRSVNAGCEFIIITPMLANPDAVHCNMQEEYRPALLAMEDTGVAIADMTYWHKWLLTQKSYQDMTGNNINHPNDYLSRWYAQLLVALLIEEEKE